MSINLLMGMIRATEVTLNSFPLHICPHPLNRSSLGLVTTPTLIYPMSEVAFVTIRSNVSVKRRDNHKSKC